MRIRRSLAVMFLVAACVLAGASVALASPNSAGHAPANATAQASDLAGIYVAPVLAVRAAHQTTYVYITDHGIKYHRWGCQYLRLSRHRVSLKYAKSHGYTPCSRCKPPT